MGVVEDFIKLTGSEKLKQLKIWDVQYYNDDSPTVSDEEYDECVRYYNANYKNKYVSSLGKASEQFIKFQHTYPVLSLDKVITKEAFIEGAAKFNFNCVLEPKLDGLTIVYYPDGKLVSRGNGTVGEILNADREIPGLPEPFKYPIRLEAVIKKSDFYLYFKKNSQKARNLAAGILRRKVKSNEDLSKGAKSSEDVKHITFYAYNILGADDMSETEQMDKLKELGFNVPDVLTVHNQDDIERAYQTMEQWSKEQDYWTDGVVIKANIAKNIKDYGMTAHHPNNAFAFKFVSMEKETTIKEIEWSMGYDRLTPVAIFVPVMLGGSKVERASLHNLNIMRNLGIKIGAKAVVTLKNEIIPQIIKCDGNGADIIIPSICPSCGNSVKINSSQEIVCENSKCEAKILDTLNKIASKNGLNIVGLGPDLIPIFLSEAKLRGKDIFNPFSIFEWEEDLFASALSKNAKLKSLKRKKANALDEIDLFEEPITNIEDTNKNINLKSYSATKIYTEIKKKRENVSQAAFLYCCNIDELGINTATIIMQEFADINELLDKWTEEKATGHKNRKKEEKYEHRGRMITGVGEVTYNSLKNNMDKIRSYMKYITFAPNNLYISKAEKPNESRLRICISGSLSKPKSYYKDMITNTGNIYCTSVTQALDYLVSYETGTNKVNNAIKWGIPIITEDQLIDLLNKDQQSS